MKARSFDSVVRGKVAAALVPPAALLVTGAVSVGLSRSGYAALAIVLSVGASWVAFVFRDDIFRRTERAGDYSIGLRSERVVRQQLESLKGRHLVRHDISLPFGGNIDHVVCGPTGAFAIETKTNRYLDAHLPLARRRAKWLSTRLDGHWVTPVICLVNRSRAPFQARGVWVVCAGDLREWLESRHDRPIDPVFALRAL